MIGKTFSHYEIIELIGRGGMGVVYKALDTKLGRPVAIKMLPSEFASDEVRKKRLVGEARAASALNHPNICTIYEINEEEGILFLVMEYLKGGTLAKKIYGRPVDQELGLDIAMQIIHGLGKAHQLNIIHRDIKPSNIFILDDGMVKLLDFGLARVLKEVDPDMLSRASTESNLTKEGNVAGTINYMSPEQISGASLDSRSDIFSFGIVLYEMLTGRPPFQGNTLFDVASSILRDQPTPVTQLNPNISAALERIVQKCIAKLPDQRFQTCSEVLSDLKRVKEKRKTREEARPSIAVLYFENLSRNKEDEYFRDGMTEDIVTELCKIKNLWVFPRSAILEYRDKAITVPNIATKLNATHVLTGSIRTLGSRFRISTQLVFAETGQLIWGERYDRQMSDMFDTQDEIARTIASALKITLSANEERAIAYKPTENTQAYDYYLRGRNYARRCTQTDLEIALEMYENAVALDPNFSLAYAGLANVCGMFYDWHGQQRHWIIKGEAAAKKALLLQPELPEALAALARILWSQHIDYESVIRYSLRAIEQKPETEGAYWSLGQAYVSTNRLEEAAAIAARAIEATGDDYNVYIPYISALDRLQRFDEVRQIRVRKIAQLKEHLERIPQDSRARILLAADYASNGEYEEAMKESENAVGQRPNDSAILYNAACVFGILGKKEEALKILKKAGAAGLSKWDWVKQDPDLACLHDDPEFQQLVQDGIQKIKKGESG